MKNQLFLFIFKSTHSAHVALAVIKVLEKKIHPWYSFLIIENLKKMQSFTNHVKCIQQIAILPTVSSAPLHEHVGTTYWIRTTCTYVFFHSVIKFISIGEKAK